MVIDKQPLWRQALSLFRGFDAALSLAVFFLLSAGMFILYSAGIDFPGRFEDQARNILIGFVCMFVAANLPPSTLLKIAVPVYTIGVALLIGVAAFGLIKKGARRWLNVGVVIQPSEMMKIAMPLLLAWYFQRREGVLRLWDFTIAALLLVVPVALIAKQPDLGTALLVAASGFYVIFFAGLSWKVLTGLFITGLASLPIAWTFLHDYQRQRVLTLIDPTTDPLGKGFHIIQATIAIGSGGLFGKGWLQGTQAHLEFIPERTTDFIFAVYGEELGLIGNVILIIFYLFLVGRGLMIAATATTLFSRLLAGSISMIFFTYAFVNMGMVSGILPVVGVPLPFVSYGGTALVTLGVGIGMLMSIARQRHFVQTGQS